MNNETFRQLLDSVGLTQVQFALLTTSSTRVVNMWATGERHIPGPVAAYLNLLSALPAALRVKEIARLTQEPDMSGMFKFDFEGAAGTGLGVLVLTQGKVFGSDGAVQYDGTYEPSSTKDGYVDARVKMTVPPGTELVQGVPAQPMQYSFEVQAQFAARGTTTTRILTPFGEVEVTMSFIRDLPADLAA